MKIVIIAGFAPSILNFRKPLILELMQHAEVVVFAPYEDEATAQAITALGARYCPIRLQPNGINPWSDFRSLINLFFLLKKEKPDKVISYTIKPVIWGSLAAHHAGVKQIYSLITGLGYAFTNVTSAKRRIIQKIVTMLYKNALKCNRLVFFQNPDDRNDFQSLNILNKQQKSIIINGSGVDLFYYEFSKVSATKPLRFLMIARLLKDKGVEEYINAAIRIKKMYSTVEFHLVGYRDYNPSVISQEMLDDAIKSGVIFFHGQLEDVRPAIQLASVYVLPSYREGTPRSVLEAMSMGRAIITTDVPGCRETVIDGYNGFLVLVKDIDSLVIAMQKFIENPSLVESMGLAGRQLAIEKYDVHQVNQTILTAIMT